MKDLTTISSDLFNKVRSRFTDIKIGDEAGALTTDPAQARFFDVNFKEGGVELGRVNIKVDEKAITIIYNHAMTENQAESVKQSWFKFLKDMRQFARKNMLTFDTRDITKSNLEKRDYQYLAQKNIGEPKMSESKLFGTSKTSYQDVGEAKIIVKHSQPVNYNIPAGRTQHIEAIYIESSTGERFKYPHRHLNGARAMARHVANGGTAYDAIGSYISGLSEELGKLRQFKNYTQRSGVMAEALGDITERVMERIESIKSEISDLQKQTHYEGFKESFAPSETQEVPEDLMNTWVDALTIKTFNEELKSVFPYIYKLVGEKKESELDYEDLVKEAGGTGAMEKLCPDCHKDPCECDEGVKEEHSLLSQFEQTLNQLTTFDYEVDEADKGDMDNDGEDEPDDQEYLQNKDAAIKAATAKDKPQKESVLPQEVVEFIASMYDRESGTFPRGEEGVKIAVEKKFGEQAGRFAHYVVEKLSAKGQMPEPTMQEEPVQMADPAQDELLRIRSLAGM